MAGAFVGLEMYGGVDPDGALRAFGALERLAEGAGVLDELGPVARSAVRLRLRRTGRAQQRAGVRWPTYGGVAA